MEDILPPLLEKINQDFDERAANSKKLKRFGNSCNSRCIT